MKSFLSTHIFGLTLAEAIVTGAFYIGNKLQPYTPLGHDRSINPSKTESEAPEVKIRGTFLVNQHGYIARGPKTAVYTHTNTAPFNWSLVNSGGSTLMSGQSRYVGQNPSSEHFLHHIDFSAFTGAEKNLRLRIGTNYSPFFNVDIAPYKTLLSDSFKYYYYNRRGHSVSNAYTPFRDPSLSRAAGHVGETLTCYSGADLWGQNWPSCDYTKTLTGGWYDAGDYGNYAVTTGVTTWTLLNLYETHKRQNFDCAVTYADGDILFPDNNNTKNDLLDEAEIGIRFLLDMQIKSRQPVGYLATSGHSQSVQSKNLYGMVHHKVHGSNWPANTTAPDEDINSRYLYPPSTAATLHLAAIGGQCARLMPSHNKTLSEDCLKWGEIAYDRAQRNSGIFAVDNFDGGGAISDDQLNDEFLFAATELWLTTGKDIYLQDIQSYLQAPYDITATAQPYWQNLSYFALASLALNGKPTNAVSQSVIDQAKSHLLTIADAYMIASDTGMRVPNPSSDYYWGSNANLLNRALLIAHADLIAPKPAYKTAIVNVMDYLLGVNPLAQSYISGYGSNPAENPHHRFWSNSIDPTHPKPPPGVLVGGPQNTALIDQVTSTLQGQCEAQTCWVDDFDAYTVNEVAINWNAPLVWVSNWIDSRYSVCSYEPLNPNADVY